MVNFKLVSLVACILSTTLAWSQDRGTVGSDPRGQSSVISSDNSVTTTNANLTSGIISGQTDNLIYTTQTATPSLGAGYSSNYIYTGIGNGLLIPRSGGFSGQYQQFNNQYYGYNYSALPSYNYNNPYFYYSQYNTYPSLGGYRNANPLGIVDDSRFGYRQMQDENGNLYYNRTRSVADQGSAVNGGLNGVTVRQ